MIYREEKNMSTGFSVGEVLTLFSTFSTSTVVCDDDNNNGV
jgi:hypothetical protein